MENLSVLQQRIKQKRQAFERADLDYYNALQAWSLTADTSPGAVNLTTLQQDAEAKQQLRATALQSLQAEIAGITTEKTPQQLIGDISSDLPFLMMPVRIEARYATVRHVVRNLPKTDAADVTANPSLANIIRSTGFERDEEGVMTYQVQALHLLTLPLLASPWAAPNSLFNSLKPPGNKYIRRKNDDHELRIRIYPDELFTEGLERALQPSEWDDGISFWNAVCSGADQHTAWMQLAVLSSPSRAAWIVKKTRPLNAKAGNPLPAVPVFADAVHFKDGAYTTPPVTRLLPERFVVRLYKNNAFKDFVGQVVPEPLILGIDPTHDPYKRNSAASGMTDVGGRIQTPEYLKWMHDFDEAEKTGLGIRINLDLNPEYKDGVDKIVVVGAKLSADETDSGRLLNELLENHLYKEDGLAVIPKGTPTNNYGDSRPAFSNSEQTADAYFQSDWQLSKGGLRSDKSRLVEALGLSDDFNILFKDCTDISEAALCNQMLWPATLGYYLLQFFTPQLDEAVREQARQFFTKHVIGRGTLPVLRVNRQPYGIIPISSFGHWQYAAMPATDEEKLAKWMWSTLLSPMNVYWQSLIGKAKNIDAASAASPFTDLMSLNPSAMQLQAEWVAGLQFQEVMKATAQNTTAAVTGLSSDPAFRPLDVEGALSKLGIDINLFKAISGTYSTPAESFIKAFIDGLPASDALPLEHMPGKSWNYLEWLSNSKVLDIWGNNFSPAPAGDGIAESMSATSVFAAFARQAVLRSFLEAGLKAVEPNPGMWLLKAKNFEAEHLYISSTSSLINVNPATPLNVNKLVDGYRPILSKYGINTPFVLDRDRRNYLSKAYPATGVLTLADWLDMHKMNDSLPALKDVLTATGYFSKASTAQLGRLFREHLDVCSHRLDAWLTGLVDQRLLKQRVAKPKGLYIGAFGYLLGLKPNTSPSVVITESMPEYMPLTLANMNLAAIPLLHKDGAKANGLDVNGADWDRTFFYIGDNKMPQLRLNTATGHIEPDGQINLNNSDGFIHAPSVTHATTAAVLRAGYLNHKADDMTALSAIQLNSPRVRKALQMLEGMQQGLSLNELLGYYFERLLHDNTPAGDGAVYNLRHVFAIKRTDTAAPAATPIDGMELLRKYRLDKASNYTKWLAVIPGIVPSQYAAITQQAAVLDQYADAFADLLLTETVHQMVKGNKDRASATLRMLNAGGHVIMPDFVRTPLSGSAITHRVGVVFRQQAAAAFNNTSPRSAFTQSLNDWLIDKLPAFASIIITIDLPTGRRERISVAELNIEAQDLLQAMPATFQPGAQSVFGLFVWLAARRKFNLLLTENASDFIIDFKDRSLLSAVELSLFEVSSLVASLRLIISDSRALTANDFLMPDKKAAGNDAVDAAKIKDALTGFLLPGSVIDQAINELRRCRQAMLDSIQQPEPDSASLQTLIDDLLNSLANGWKLSIPGNMPGIDILLQQDVLQQWLVTAGNMADDLEKRLAIARQSMSSIPPALSGQPLFDQLREITVALFGDSVHLFPDIILKNAAEVKNCMDGLQWIDNASPDALEQWMSEASLVRKYLRAYRKAVLLSEALKPELNIHQTVLQFPFSQGVHQAWIGGKIPAGIPAESCGVISLVLEMAAPFDSSRAFSGFIIDEWPEWIPEKTVDTGVTFQYDQPDTEPPQTMLLAVSPVEGANWNWEYLIGAVNEALDMSKKRVLTLTDVTEGNKGLSQILPALVLPFMKDNMQTPVTPLF